MSFLIDWLTVKKSITWGQLVSFQRLSVPSSDRLFGIGWRAQGNVHWFQQRASDDCQVGWWLHIRHVGHGMPQVSDVGPEGWLDPVRCWCRAGEIIGEAVTRLAQPLDNKEASLVAIDVFFQRNCSLLPSERDEQLLIRSFSLLLCTAFLCKTE